MKTHYDPYMPSSLYPNEEEPPEFTYCGTITGEEYYCTNSWDRVTCKKCLKGRDRIALIVNKQEEIIINQMGDMAEFFNKELTTK